MYEPINLQLMKTPLVQQTKLLPTVQSENPKTNFSEILKSAINQINNVQKEADFKTEMLVRGEMTDLHDVMISIQKASITIETAVQVQQKVIDAYSEIMRMQI